MTTLNTTINTTMATPTCYMRVGCGNGSAGKRCDKPVFTGKCGFNEKGKCVEHIAKGREQASWWNGYKKELASLAPALDKAIAEVKVADYLIKKEEDPEEAEECPRCKTCHCEEDKHHKTREFWKSNTDGVDVCRGCIAKEDEEEDE